MTDTTHITDARRFEGANRRSSSRPDFGARAALLVAAAIMFAAAYDSPADQPPYVITDIPAPPGAISGVPTAINAHGHVVGWANYSQSPVLRAWRWSPQEGTILLPQPPSATLYRAVDINDDGVIAGDGGFDGGVAWRYENGQYTSLGTMPGFPISNSEGINNFNQIAGTAKDFSFLTPNRGFVHSNATGIVNITPDFGARATDINDAGQICGYSQSNNAFRWSEDTGIEFIPAPVDLPLTFAFAINDQGQVVGEAKSANGNIARAFIYTDGFGTQTLPHLAGQLNRALGVNSHGQVVGYSDPPGSLVAWVWSAVDGLLVLNSLIDPDANLNLLRAHDINDAGQIICSAVDTAVGGSRIVLLTPAVDSTPGDVNGDGIVNVQDLLMVISNWGSVCDPGENCPGDANGDGIVNVHDLLLVISNWGATG